ncbi:MAG: hypothetical protein ACRDJS_05930 [Actinomycetota bacterium]
MLKRILAMFGLVYLGLAVVGHVQERSVSGRANAPRTAGVSNLA